MYDETEHSNYTLSIPTLARVNPYCEVIVDGQKDGQLKTEVKKKCPNPLWDDEFTV